MSLNSDKTAAMPRIIPLVTLLLLSLQSLAETTLFSSEYFGKSGSFNVRSTRELVLQDNGLYLFKSEVKHRIGSIRESSEFRIENGKLIPLLYQYKRKILGISKEESIRFDWDKKEAYYRRVGKESKNKTHKLEAGMLDPALYQLQLQRDAYAGAFSASSRKDVEYTVIRHRKVKKMPFVLEKEDNFRLDGKDYTALLLKLDADEDKQTRVWVSPEFNFHLTKIEHTDEDGDTYVINMDKYEADPKIFDVIYNMEP